MVEKSVSKDKTNDRITLRSDYPPSPVANEPDDQSRDRPVDIRAGDGSQLDAYDGDNNLSFSLSDLRETVGILYVRVLGRPADVYEIDVWVESVRNGRTLADMLRAIAGSHEAAEQEARCQRLHHDITPFATDLTLVYRAGLGRSPRDDEIGYWFTAHRGGQAFFAIAESIFGSDEAVAKRKVAEVPDGIFVQLAINLVQHRGAPPIEIATWQAALARSDVTRPEILLRLFGDTMQRMISPTPEHRNDPTRAWLAGADRHVDRAEWRARRTHPDARDGAIARFPFARSRADQPLVSIITSLYRGGKHIDFFLRNMAAQTIFDQCELIIVDAASDQLEEERIADFKRGRDNIVYLRQPTRIGIYEAWNIAVRAARGAYLTNANLDDCRRSDSIERQAATLDALPFVDVVHQDTFYSFEGDLPFTAIAEAGLRARFENGHRYSLMTGNPPHNAPMWRRSLHDDVGLFNEHYESAGDYEFWLRCAVMDKAFYLLADPHAAYFYNPEGVSTRPSTPAKIEIDAITQTWFGQLVDPALVESSRAFLDRVSELAGSDMGLRDAGPAQRSDIEWRRAAIHRALLGLAGVAHGAAE